MRSCSISFKQIWVTIMYTYRVIRVAGLWRVVDRSNGDKVMGFSMSHKGAVRKAKDLEVRLRTAIAYMIESRKAA